jgi:hypothetical protein
LTGVAVNVTGVPEQIVAPGLAEMLTEGTTAGFTVTAKEAAELLPQALVAVTVTLPPVLPHVTVIEVALLAVMLAPDGTPQVYPVAPLTGEIV